MRSFRSVAGRYAPPTAVGGALGFTTGTGGRNHGGKNGKAANTLLGGWAKYYHGVLAHYYYGRCRGRGIGRAGTAQRNRSRLPHMPPNASVAAFGAPGALGLATSSRPLCALAHCEGTLGLTTGGRNKGVQNGKAKNNTLLLVAWRRRSVHGVRLPSGRPHTGDRQVGRRRLPHMLGQCGMAAADGIERARDRGRDRKGCAACRCCARGRPRGPGSGRLPTRRVLLAVAGRYVPSHWRGHARAYYYCPLARRAHKRG